MPAPGGGGTEVQEPVEPQSLKKLSLKSLKRSLDLFAPAHGDRFAALSDRSLLFALLSCPSSEPILSRKFIGAFFIAFSKVSSR